MSPAFLGSWCEECCCPAIKCCTKDTLVIQVSGFSGSVIGTQNLLKFFYDASINGGGPWCEGKCGFPSFVELELFRTDYTNVCGSDPPNTDGCERALKATKHTLPHYDTLPTVGPAPDCCYTQSEYVGVQDCFPPVAVQESGEPYEICETWPFFCEPMPEDAPITCDFFNDDPGAPFPCIVPGACDGTPIRYIHPRDAKKRSGLSGSIYFEEDYNQTYVLRRFETPRKPEIVVKINRQVPRKPSDTDATLLFELERKRQVLIDEVGPQPVARPLGFSEDYYVIDYRCQDRNIPDPLGDYTCNAPIGYAKPHLEATSEQGNDSADIFIPSIPHEYIPDLHLQLGLEKEAEQYPFPITWTAGDPVIKSAGGGYQVGDTFRIFFRDDELATKAVSQYLVPDQETGEPEPFIDENDLKLTVASVDESGGILSLSRTSPPSPVLFTRVLCHSRSVLYGGSGYTVGDTIEFHVAPNTDAEEIETAVAVVEDVDENGSILDWHIRGSDQWTTYWPAVNGNNCRKVPCTGENAYDPNEGCRTCFCSVPPEIDQRGIYKWTAPSACSLEWTGSFAMRNVDVANVSISSYQCNPRIGSHDVTVEPFAAETNCTMETYPQIYPYEVIETRPLRYEDLARFFQPFPPPAGSGFLADVTIENGGNESAIGGKVTAVNIVDGGSGYAFQEIRHIEPVLPTVMPEDEFITTPAEFAYEFDAVHDFPQPGYKYPLPEDYTVEFDRFSYFPVSSVEIVSGGAGYEVGHQFVIEPLGRFDEEWGEYITPTPNSDDPQEVPNGTFYAGGVYARVNADGYITGYGFAMPEGHTERFPTLKVQVTDVDENGAITEVEILERGMMYKPIPAGWKAHPFYYAAVNSNIGYGANVRATISETSEGNVESVEVVEAEEWWPDDPANPGNPIPVGGRDYLNTESGLAYKITYNGYGSMRAGDFLGINPFRPERTEWTVEAGQLPPYLPMSQRVSVNGCFDDLAKTYELYTAWTSSSNAANQFTVDQYPLYHQPGPLCPEQPNNTGTIGNSWVVLKRRYLSGIGILATQYRTIEYGMTVTVSELNGAADCDKWYERGAI